MFPVERTGGTGIEQELRYGMGTSGQVTWCNHVIRAYFGMKVRVLDEKAQQEATGRSPDPRSKFMFDSLESCQWLQGPARNCKTSLCGFLQAANRLMLFVAPSMMVMLSLAFLCANFFSRNLSLWIQGLACRYSTDAFQVALAGLLTVVGLRLSCKKKSCVMRRVFPPFFAHANPSRMKTWFCTQDAQTRWASSDGPRPKTSTNNRMRCRELEQTSYQAGPFFPFQLT